MLGDVYVNVQDGNLKRTTVTRDRRTGQDRGFGKNSR